jgi:hypothetical protein
VSRTLTGRGVCFRSRSYLSLTRGVSGGHHSLFVHVPAFSTINQADQMAFVLSLLRALYAQLKADTCPAPAPPKQWACRACTLSNGPRRLKCDACNGARF